MRDELSIRALIRLIDDPDDGIFEHVKDTLLACGAFAIPYLEDSWEEQNYGLIFQARIEQIIHEIQFDDIKSQLENWGKSSDKDLLTGAILVAKYQYPGLNEQLIHNEINRLKNDIWLEINSKQTAFEKVKIINKIFFELHHYHGDSKHFHSPMNSYINAVIESKKGNPLSLSLIYSVVAQSLELPIYGVNLPNHFVLAYMDEFGVNQYLPTKNEFGVLFYLNPFSKGSILDANAIKKFLAELRFPQNRSYFEPCSNTAIIKRMLNNLIGSFQQVGNSSKVNELIILRAIFD